MKSIPAICPSCKRKHRIKHSIRPITRRQAEVLQFVAGWMQQRQYPPTLDEIASSLHTCRTTAWEHVNNLAVRGNIELTPGRYRRILKVIMPKEVA